MDLTSLVTLSSQLAWLYSSSIKQSILLLWDFKLGRIFELNRKYQTTAVSFRSQIVLFGGVYFSQYNYILSGEGSLVSDLSVYPGIPDRMCPGSVTLLKGKIYAVNDEEWFERVNVFGGKKWYKI